MIKKVISYISLYAILINLFSGLLYTDITYANNNDKTKLDGISNQKVNTDSYSNDRVIIKFKKDKGKTNSLSTIKSKVKTKSFKKLDYLDKLNVGVLSFDNKKENIESVINELKKIPDIAYVEKDYIRTTSYTGVTTNDTRSIEQWYLKSIQADEAWKIYDDTSDKITVSVNDSGIDYTHPDLVGSLKDLSTNCKSETGAIIAGGCVNHGWNYEDILYSTISVLPQNDIFDINGHGSHVSGIIGATGNNGTGVIGVTQNAEIMGTRLESYNLYDGYFYISNIIKGIDFSIQNGAKIINASYGGATYSQAEYDSIQTAKNNGVLFITAAGNEGVNSDNVSSYPDGYDLDNIIAVASVGSDDNIAYYSNYGNVSIDVAAPGGNSIIDSGILSTTPLEETIYENGLTSFSGSTPLGTNPDWYLYNGNYGYHTQTPLYYSGGLDYKLYFDQSFSLAGADAAKMKGYLSCDFGSGLYDADYGDTLSFFIFDNDSNTSLWLDTFYKDYNGYIEIPLTNPVFFKNNINLWMNFVTDTDNDVGQGCRIDNLSIVKYSKSKHTYESLQGTSMATPVVTGIASMLWSYKPDLTYLEVKDLILSSVDLIPSLNGKVLSNGKVNAKNAVKELIRRYGITKNGSLEGQTFITPLINLNGKNISLSGSIINFSSTGTIISLSGSTITGSGDLNIGTGTSLFNNGSNFLNTSGDFKIQIKNSSGTILNNSSTINGESLILDYTGSKLGNLNIDITTDLGGILFSGPLLHDISFPVNENFTGGLSAKVYKNGDSSNGISSGVLLKIIDAKILDNLTFNNLLLQTITGTLDFASGAYTKDEYTFLNITSNIYPIDYQLTGDLVGTYTGTLYNSGSIQVHITPLDGVKNISLILSKNSQLSETYTGSIILDYFPPNIYFTSHFNNQQIYDSSLILTGNFGYCGQDGELLGICGYETISSFKINGSSVIFSGATFSKSIDLILGNNPINYEATDLAGNTITGSINIERVNQPVLTGSLEFTSGSITNNTLTTINLTSSNYPVNYILSGSLVGTYTGTLNNNGSLQIELTSGSGLKYVYLNYSFSGFSNSINYQKSILLDTLLPEINILSHINNQIVNQSSITLNGTLFDVNGYCDNVSILLNLCQESSISSLSINGNQVTLSGTTFSKNIDLALGSNTITYEVTDNAGNILTGSININRIESGVLNGTLNFSSGSFTNNTTTNLNLNSTIYPINYTITGDITNSLTGTLNNSGNIAVDLNAGDGVKNISIIYTSTGGTLNTSHTGSIILDQTLPALNFLSYLDNEKATSSSIYLTGTLFDQNGINSLTLDGSTVLLSGYNFTKSLNLNPGNNNITYQVIDNAGNTLTGSINIIRVGNTSNISSNIIANGNVNISFNTELSSIGEVMYGTSEHNLNQSITSTNGLSHSIELTGLTPNTQYFYQVRGNNNGYTGTLSTINTFITPTSYNVDNNIGNNSNSGSLIFIGTNFSGSGVSFNSSGSIQLNTLSGGHNVVLSLSGLTIHSNGWNGIFNPPVQSTFSGTFNNSGYNHITELTFKIGNDDSELSLSGNTAQVNIFVGTTYNGKTLGIFRSTNNGSTYNFLKTCIVSAGICSFTSDRFSLFTFGTVVATTLGSSSSSSTSGGGSSSGGSSSGGFGGTMIASICIDSQLQCKATSAENGFKWYRKDGVSCEGGNLGNTCNAGDIVINDTDIEKLQPVKYLNNGYTFKSKILESLFNKKISYIIKIDDIISDISYLGKDLENYMFSYRKSYNELLYSVHKIDDLLVTKDLVSVREEFKNFLKLYKDLNDFKYEGKVKTVEISGNNVSYLVYNDLKITKIQKLLFEKLQKKIPSSYIYRLANKVVYNLNTLLTNKSITKEEIQTIREETISLYKEFIIQYNKLEIK